MSNAKRIPRTESPPEGRAELQESADSPTPPDHLADYRRGLEDLASAQEKLATLRGAADTAQTELSRLEAEHEESLTQAASGDIDADTLGVLGELKSRTEIYERKISDLGKRIGEAQSDLDRQCAGLSACLVTLQRAFYAHSFARARQALSDQLSPGVAGHILDLIGAHHLDLVSVRALEITSSTDPASLLAQGARLVESVSGAEGFNVPPLASSAFLGHLGAAHEPPKPRLVGPWLDRGLSEKEINDFLYRVRVEHPALDLAQANEELAKAHPELFITEAEFLEMNRPISQPAPLKVTPQEAAA